MGQDGEMMASLPYAEVALSSGEVVQTDVNGFVNISAEEIASADYVVIRSAGYDDIRIELTSLEDQSINKVELKPRSLPIFTASKEN